MVCVWYLNLAAAMIVGLSTFLQRKEQEEQGLIYGYPFASIYHLQISSIID